MSGTELAAILYDRQGFVVMAIRKKCSLGELWNGYSAAQAGVPLRITGLSSAEEYRAQVRLSRDLAPDLVPSRADDPAFDPALGWPEFYRVEAAD